MEVEGWILHFFGIYERHTFMGFPEFTIKVPIKLINTITNQEKSLLLVSDFVSVSKFDDRSYKPDVGLTIFHVRTGKNQLEKRIK